MFREIEERLIRPEALMASKDLAKLGCNDCKDCCDCCKDRAERITTDAYDVRLLKKHWNLSFEGLLEQGLLELAPVDGIILPCLPEKKEACYYLNEKGRCSIYEARPGICRMFPLARIYQEDGSFSYFMQEGECSRNNGVKVRISKWLGYPDIRGYEQSVREYHNALRILRSACQSAKTIEEKTRLQKEFLEQWFLHSS